MTLASAVGMRLNEAAQHSWDVRVALDPQAELGADAAEVLVDHYTGELGSLLGFLGKADHLADPAVIPVGDSGVALVVDDSMSLRRSTDEPTARFDGGSAAALRLLAGRLKAPYVRPGLQVSGNVTLADLPTGLPRILNLLDAAGPSESRPAPVRRRLRSGRKGATRLVPSTGTRRP